MLVELSNQLIQLCNEDSDIAPSEPEVLDFPLFSAVSQRVVRDADNKASLSVSVVARDRSNHANSHPQLSVFVVVVIARRTCIKLG